MALQFAENKEKPPVPIAKTDTTEQQENKEKPPVPITKTDTTERQKTEPPSSESQEMNTLFDNISQLSNEQYAQNAEMQKKAIQAAIDEIKRMSEKKKLSPSEWEAFFYQNDILPILSTRDFLYALGECFNCKKIDDRMHKLLKEQLKIIEKYIVDRNIKLQNIGISDPLGYAESKIDAAHRTGNDGSSLLDRKQIFIILVVLGAVIRILARCGVDNLEEKEKAQQQVRNEEFQEFIERQSMKEELEMMKQFYDEHDMWTKERMVGFLGMYSDDMLENALEKEIILQEGIALWDWREEERPEENVYEIHEMPVSENVHEDYHIYAFCVTSESEQSDKALLCDLETLGFSKDCSIYYYNGTEYVKIPMLYESETDTQDSNEIYGIDLMEQRAFLVDTHICDVQNPYPIVLIEALKDTESNDSSVNDDAMKEVVENAVERRIEVDVLKILTSLTEEEQQNALNNAVCLQEGIYLSDISVGVDAEKEKTEDIAYSIQELPIYEQVKEQYHIFAFYVTANEIQRDKALWCDPKALGFHNNYKIYYGDQSGFEEAKVNEILNHQVLAIDVWENSTEPLSIVVLVEEVTSDEFALTEEDFIIAYDDIVIDGDTLHTEMFEALGCPEDFDAYNGGYISSGNGYRRWNLCYPSYEDSEIRMIYLTDDSLDVANPEYQGESYLIGISLEKIETERGLKVGDTLEKMISLYGEPDVVQPYSANELLEEAIYCYGDYKLKVVFADDIVQYILIDYSMDESIMKQFMGIEFGSLNIQAPSIFLKNSHPKNAFNNSIANDKIKNGIQQNEVNKKVYHKT